MWIEIIGVFGFGFFIGVIAEFITGATARLWRLRRKKHPPK